MIVSDTPIGLYGASFVAGFVVGAIVMLPPLLLSAAFGAQSYGTAYSLTNAGMYGAVAATTAVTGALHDWTGSYDLSFWLLCAVHVLAALVIVSGRKSGPGLSNSDLP